MGISAPRLRQSRHGVFVFRYLVPPKFRELFGKKELRRSLRTKNAVDARVQALNLNTVIERLLKHLPPENAMNEIKKLMDAGIHSWEVEVNGVIEGIPVNGKIDRIRRLYDGTVIIEDLRSTNGIYVNGQLDAVAGREPVGGLGPGQRADDADEDGVRGRSGHGQGQHDGKGAEDVHGGRGRES